MFQSEWPTLNLNGDDVDIWGMSTTRKKFLWLKGFYPFLQIGKLSKPTSIWFSILNWCSWFLFQLIYLPAPPALTFALWIHQNCIRCSQTNALQLKLKKRNNWFAFNISNSWNAPWHCTRAKFTLFNRTHQMLVLPDIPLIWPCNLKIHHFNFVRLSHKLNKSHLLQCALWLLFR